MGASRGRTIEHTIEVDCPIAVVWDVWSDVRRLPELSKSTTEVRDAPERLTEVGQSFCQIAGAVGQSVAVRWEVVEIEPQDHLVIEGSPGYGVRVTITEAVAAAGASCTVLTLTTTYRLPFGPLGKLVAKLGLDRLADREAREVLDGVARLAREATVLGRGARG